MTQSNKMTSRERVLASIRHQEPDRVPVDLGSTPSSGISAIAYHNLKHYLGITKGHTRVYDVVQQFAQPEDMILERFGIDVSTWGACSTIATRIGMMSRCPRVSRCSFLPGSGQQDSPAAPGTPMHPMARASPPCLLGHLLRSDLFPLPGWLSRRLQGLGQRDAQDPLGWTGPQSLGPCRRARLLAAAQREGH